MATITVLKFLTPEGAEEALGLIQCLNKQHLINIHDAAIVSWPEGQKSPRTRQLTNMAVVGAMSGMFGGLLLGLVFFTPLFGMAVGAAFGALGGMLRDYGIDDDFVAQVRSKVTPGTSALFLMTSETILDRVAHEMNDLKFEIIATSLSGEQERKLREAFGQE